MDRKKLVLLLGALVVAIGSAFLARSMFSSEPAPVAAAQEAPTGPKVLVANRALPVGTIITADAMGYQQWPEELVQDAYFIEGNSDMSQLLGTVVRFPITAGEPVTHGSLVSPGDRGFLAAALGPGMRAVTVAVSSAQSAVAGFIFPGDRVDMVLTQQVQGEGRPLSTAETVLRNLRVLATDQATESVTDESGQTVVRAYRTVTIEVTPQIAEKVAVAQTIGDLTLVLRSISDNQAELERAIASGDIKVPDNATPEEEERILRAAMSKPTQGKSTYQTGGDVSRFQRRSIPPQNDGRPGAAAAPKRGDTFQATSGRTGAMPPVRRGPTVRVIRGKVESEVPVSGGIASATGQLNNNLANGVGQAGKTAPVGLSTLR
ncbi:Flp pilus assembly protein CpaB [Qipengyuania sp. S6317L1]|uniref:Flp pilus assembly protein CpaB n=1 Tax=Qipengyuania sp. S6317L1 TaxID=2926410 RepID=UPI001FF11830|nr:Flp pilus assembly protein CpaB [Qipengyuania sp. S6317L1]MCK0099747.1 Flp pilus assembly protein CpaB [Qipengyuania sp. S6317L1]